MDFTSLPPYSIRQCFAPSRGLKNSSSFSSSPLSLRRRCKNVNKGCPAYAYPSLGTDINFSPRCISCISKKQSSALCLCSGRKVEFNHSYLFENSGPLKKYSRHIVRSEMAEPRVSGADHPFSAFKVLAQVRGICFYAVTAVAAIFLIQLMLVAHPFVLLFDRYRRKAQHLIAKIWATLTITPFYGIQIQGLENLPPPDTPAVYVSNHQSFLDIFTLLTLGRSFKFISKTEIFLFPVIGWAMYMMGTIPLRRMDAGSQIWFLHAGNS